ncbi:hypothetical protein AGMMS49921_04180 [Endomicrobiia bacterium]|nr:hypothetical protein AGMMS49921_04180 [Endomicrobiia bacterium]
MKQKKKAVKSDVMDLVLMGVKKAFDKRVKDSKERREEKKRRKTEGAKQIQDLTELKNKIHTNTLTLKKRIE